MKLKIIDLIIAIANKEKVPYKIKYDGKEMVYDGNKQDYLGYYSNGNGEWLFQYLFDRCKNTSHFINDYVEVMEEDKEIEEVLEIELLGQCDNWLQKRDVNIKSDFELNPYILEAINRNFKGLYHKQCELIKAVNELKKGK